MRSKRFYGKKMAPLRSSPVALVQQPRVWKRNRRRWQRLKEVTVDLQRRGDAWVHLGQMDKVSNRYKHQLQRTQQLKHFYRVRDSYLKRCQRERGKNLLGILERRLQRALFRRFLCPRAQAAKQMIAHGKVLVNGVVRRQRGFLLRGGDFVEVRGEFPWLEKHLRGDYRAVWTQLPFRCPPPHLEVRLSGGCFVFAYEPRGRELKFPFVLDLGAVRDFYRHRK